MADKTFQELGEEIVALQPKYKQKVIAIDGGGGAGKSTFAKYLQERIPGAVVIHIDDFYIGPWDKRLEHTNYDVSPMFDWDRFKKEIVEPVKQGLLVSYHVYNWDTHTTEEVVAVPEAATIIVEGGYTTQTRFSDFYDFKIWIEADQAYRLTEVLKRDGEHMRYLWEEDWLPVERNYIRVHNPAAKADLVVQGHAQDYSQGSFTLI